jgi:hypothetical protein
LVVAGANFAFPMARSFHNDFRLRDSSSVKISSRYPK